MAKKVPQPAPLVVQLYAVDDLNLYHRNPRKGDVSAIAESLRVNGQYKPIVVNRGTKTGRPFEVLAGNHTLLAARKLGWLGVEGVEVDVDDARARAIVLADNRLGDLGGYDEAILGELLRATDGLLEGTGYSDSDVASLLRGLSAPVQLTNVDEAPPRPEVAVCKPGDVFELGPHRLFVGSAGDTEGVLAAFDGMLPADCVWTDPPYGVSYVGHRLIREGLANDGAAQAAAIWRSAIPTLLAAARPGAPVYVAHPDTGRDVFLLPLLEAGFRLRQTLIWVKDSMVVSRGDYHYQSEPILVGLLADPEAAAAVDDDSDYAPIAYGFAPGGEGRLGRGGPHWHGDNRQSNVFQVPRPYSSKLHPTMKPTGLVAPMIHRSAPAGGVVLDLFAGSGSTMIAAHAEGQRAALVEYDAGYADVICRRWEEHTGIVPVRGGKPVSFVGGA